VTGDDLTPEIPPLPAEILMMEGGSEDPPPSESEASDDPPTADQGTPAEATGEDVSSDSDSETETEVAAANRSSTDPIPSAD